MMKNHVLKTSSSRAVSTSFCEATKCSSLEGGKRGKLGVATFVFPRLGYSVHCLHPGGGVCTLKLWERGGVGRGRRRRGRRWRGSRAAPSSWRPRWPSCGRPSPARPTPTATCRSAHRAATAPSNSTMYMCPRIVLLWQVPLVALVASRLSNTHVSLQNCSNLCSLPDVSFHEDAPDSCYMVYQCTALIGSWLRKFALHSAVWVPPDHTN